jgi:hypothetical protein
METIVCSLDYAVQAEADPSLLTTPSGLKRTVGRDALAGLHRQDVQGVRSANR